MKIEYRVVVVALLTLVSTILGGYIIDRFYRNGWVTLPLFWLIMVISGFLITIMMRGKGALSRENGSRATLLNNAFLSFLCTVLLADIALSFFSTRELLLEGVANWVTCVFLLLGAFNLLSFAALMKLEKSKEMKTIQWVILITLAANAVWNMYISIYAYTIWNILMSTGLFSLICCITSLFFQLTKKRF